MESLTTTSKFKLMALIAIIILASCMGNLSQTAMNAMFASIAPEFGIDVGLGQLVTTTYMLVLGVTVPLVTYLMRRFSLKRLIVASIFLLAIGGLMDMLAGDFVVLVAGRVFQAVSAGILMPMMMSVIMVNYPPERRATVMGVAGIAMGFAPNIGPTIGGIMVSTLGWRSFFVVLLAIAAALLVCALLMIDSGRRPKGPAKLDVASFALSACGFCFLLVGFTNISSYALQSPLVWAPVVVGAISLTAFVVRQKRIEHPLISMDIFDSWKFSVSFWGGNVLFASFMGITLLLPLFIEQCWGGTAFQGGLALLPGTIAALFLNPLGGWLTDRFGFRPIALVGTALLSAGAVSMVFMTADTPFWLILLMQGSRACGVSLLISPMSTWGMSELSPRVMTDASSFSTAARQVCASLGTAVMVFATTVPMQFGGEATLAASYQLAFGISAVLSVGLLALAVARMRG